MPKLLLAAGAVALVLTMTGCGEPPPHVTPTPTPSAAPVFASDEEALAAAEESYRAYLAALDQALTTFETAPLEGVAAGTALKEALESVEGFESEGKVLTGVSTIDTTSLVRAEPDGTVYMYACLDVSGTDVVDASGRSTVEAGRPIRFPMEVTLHWGSASGLMVVEAEVWDGDNFCD